MVCSGVNGNLIAGYSIGASVVLVLVMLGTAGPAFAYGSSSEDLIGAFSLQKTIRLASSSECFSSPGGSDPLSPPAARTVGALADDQPPSLAGFDFEPKTFSARPDQAVNLTAHIIDDQSGLWASAAYFISPSRDLTATAFFDAGNRKSGSSKDGIYAVRLPLPKDAENEIEAGYWQLQNLTMVDGEGNRRVLEADEVGRLGMPIRFLVLPA